MASSPDPRVRAFGAAVPEPTQGPRVGQISTSFSASGSLRGGCGPASAHAGLIPCIHPSLVDTGFKPVTFALRQNTHVTIGGWKWHP